jgi:hypothetical protein
VYGKVLPGVYEGFSIAGMIREPAPASFHLYCTWDILQIFLYQ